MQEILRSTGEKILTEANFWLGRPFRYRGYDFSGCDCVGLLVGIFNKLDIFKAFINDYHAHDHGNYINSCVLWKIFIDHAQIVSRESCKAGDILLFTLARKEPNHVAILKSFNDMTVIHSYRSVGKVVENSLDDYWNERFFAAFRFV